MCVGQRNDAGDERVVLFLQVLHADGLCRNDVDFGSPKISKDDDVDNQDGDHDVDNQDVDNQDGDHDHSDRGRTWRGS